MIKYLHIVKEGEWFMGRFLKFFLASAVLLLAVGGTNDVEAAKKAVAVMPFENVAGSGANRAAEIMTEEMTVALYRSGNYTVVERNQLGQVLKETGFQMTGVVDSNKAIEFGKMIGAQYSVIGKVTLASVGENAKARLGARAADAAFGGIKVKGLGSLGNILSGTTEKMIGRYLGRVALDFRMIDNETGELVIAKNVEGSEAADDYNLALQKACHEAVENAVSEIRKKNPFTATIIDVEGDTVYIDEGSDAGVREGETFDIVKEGRPIMKNGEIIAMKYIPLGRLKVKEVNSDHSICRITEKKGVITNGALVKRGK